MNGIRIQTGRRDQSNEGRELVERCDGYRAFPGYSNFKCPCCGSGALAKFGNSGREAPEVSCVGGCSGPQVLEAAGRRPARTPQAIQPRAEWQMSDRERAQARAVRPERGRGTSWPSTEYELARLRARAEAEAVFDAEQGGTDLQPILSSLVDAEPVPDPSILRLPDGTHLLRRGWVHLFHGKPASAKTPLSYLAVVEVVQAGGHVLLVDYEMGASGAKTLLIELGLTEDQIRAHVLYAYSPRRWTQAQRDGLVAEVEARVPDLVVIDSLSRSMATEGLNQNDATETDVWFHSLPSWAADQFGSAVMLIDHTNRADGPHPSGSIQKTAAPQFHVWVQNVRPFSREHEDGCSLLTMRKDRSGQRPLGRPVAELRTTLGASFTLRAVDASAKAASGDEVEVDLEAMSPSLAAEQKVLETLQKAGTWALTKAVVGEGVASQKPRKALDRLETKGLVVQKRDPKSAKGLLWCAAEFALSDDDA